MRLACTVLPSARSLFATVCIACSSQNHPRACPAVHSTPHALSCSCYPQTRDGMKWTGPLGPPPLLVKIAPDLTSDDMEGERGQLSAFWCQLCSPVPLPLPLPSTPRQVAESHSRPRLAVRVCLRASMPFLRQRPLCDLTAACTIHLPGQTLRLWRCSRGWMA